MAATDSFTFCLLIHDLKEIVLTKINQYGLHKDINNPVTWDG